MPSGSLEPQRSTLLETLPKNIDQSRPDNFSKTPLQQIDRRCRLENLNLGTRTRPHSFITQSVVNANFEWEKKLKKITVNQIANPTRAWSVSKFTTKKKRPLSPLSSSTSNTVLIAGLEAELMDMQKV